MDTKYTLAFVLFSVLSAPAAAKVTIEDVDRDHARLRDFDIGASQAEIDYQWKTFNDPPAEKGGKGLGTRIYATSGVAETDGFVYVTGQDNRAISGRVNGRVMFETAARDKYGQGKVSGSMVVKKGESWSVAGAHQSYFMPME